MNFHNAFQRKGSDRLLSTRWCYPGPLASGKSKASAEAELSKNLLMRNPTAAFVKIGVCGLHFAQCRVRELTLRRNRCDARFLGLDYSGCVPVDVEEVVGETVSGGQLEFADGDSAAGFDVDAVAILDQPAGRGQEAVDVGAGAVLRLAGGWHGHVRLRQNSTPKAELAVDDTGQWLSSCGNERPQRTRTVENPP